MNSHQAVLKSRSIDLDQLLLQLTLEHRAPLILHCYGNMTYEDFASRLGWQRWKVKKRIYEALSIIRTAMGIVPPMHSRRSRGQSRRAEAVDSPKLDPCRLDTGRSQ